MDTASKIMEKQSKMKGRRSYMIGKQGKTAIKICSAAAVVATAWICGGMTLHSYVMESANEQERQLATDLKWDNTKLPLHSLDKSDPNNKKWSMQQQQQQQQQKN